MNRPLSSEIAEIQSWAETQGLKVDDGRTEGGKTVYSVTWCDLQSEPHTIEIEDLTGLPDFITRLIESGQAQQPGAFYVCWTVEHPDYSYWCRTRSWISITVQEGAPPPAWWIADRTIDGFDPTPYASTQEALDTIAFLGLELGARLQFYATVLDIRYKPNHIPTASYSREAVEEQILDAVRYCAYQRLDRFDQNDVDSVANRLANIGIPREKGIQAISEMIAEGRLVRVWEQERFWGKRWLKRWQNRRRLCFAEPGRDCQLVPCESCGGSGKCPICKGSGWEPDRDASSPCTNCAGRTPPHGYGYSEHDPGNGRCQRCAGEGKVGQWQQTGASPATTARSKTLHRRRARSQ